MKKSVKLGGHMVNSNIAIGSLPTLQISIGMYIGIFALFEKIHDGEPILTHLCSYWSIPLKNVR